MDEQSDMGKCLRYFREKKGLKVKEVAELVGVPESTYREWEAGRKITGHKPYLKLAAAFGISLETLLGGSPSSILTVEDLLNRVIDDLHFIQSEIKKRRE
jgi:transcriptional regulator with XRE-family HTH domain